MQEERVTSSYTFANVVMKPLSNSCDTMISGAIHLHHCNTHGGELRKITINIRIYSTAKGGAHRTREYCLE
jgi:hypothetical protein